MTKLAPIVPDIGRVGLCLLLPLLVSQTTWAQSRELLSLRAAVVRALEQHPALVAARANIGLARAARVSAGKKPNPTVLVSTENLPLGPTGVPFKFSRDVDWFGGCPDSC